MQEVAPGLHHWTAPHPEHDPDPEPGSAADWPEHVGCTLYLTPDAAVFIDPLVPEELWPALDRLVAGRPVVVLTTIRWHGRSRAPVLARYDGRQHVPPGIDALPFPRFEETMYWLPGPRALVPGDSLIGDDAGGVRVCPQSWLATGTVEELRDDLRPLLELPVEHVLCSHWDPVSGGGHAALRRALRD
jgi:hypothetical protein